MEPQGLFELEVLAHEVVAEAAGEFEVAQERGGVGGGEAGVGPVALVEDAAQVDPLAVEVQFLAAGLEAAQAGGGGDEVGRVPFAGADLDAVQVGVGGAPEARLADLDAALGDAVGVGGEGDRLAGVGGGGDGGPGGASPARRTVTSMPVRLSPRRATEAAWVRPRASSHTVCQIPEVGVNETPS
nr:hypothetical protein GCM10025732_35490 [Glycomyces mayteni]